MSRVSLFFVLFFPALGIVFAQNSESEARRGFTFYERFEGSANEAGLVTKLDTTVGYNVTSHIAVAGGIPLYFVRPSAAATAATATRAATGIGNVYGQVRLMTVNPALSFASTLTVTAPTGDKATGFSTGHATVDWSNYAERSFGKVTPFGEIGLANAVSDTYFLSGPM